MNTVSTSVIITILATVAVAQIVSFHADVTFSGDPTMPGGLASGHMNYFYNRTTGGANHNIRIDWSSPVSISEQWVYTSALHLRRCSACFAETYKLPAEQYFKLTTDVAGTSPFGDCVEYTRTTGDVKRIWVHPTSGALCKVFVQGATGTRTIVFSNYQTGNQANKLTEYTGWNCPAPVCTRVMDVMLVLDESGSISSTEWKSAIAFAKNLVSSFTIGSDAVTMGVVFFGSSARVVSRFSNSQANLLTALNTANKGGNTCIGCGMSMALSIWGDAVPGRESLNPAKLMITLTDGFNNMPSSTAAKNLTASATAVKAAGITSFAIGVGTSLSQEELKTVASTLATGPAVINVASFDSLNTILSKLVMESCTDLAQQPCGASCYGFCSCNSACVCPVCENLGACWKHNCTLTNGGTPGCVKTPVDCSTTNKCLNTWCDNNLGCQSSPVDCSGTNPCLEYYCSESSGCYTKDRVCDDHSACTADSCDPGTPEGCKFEWLCEDNNACTIDTCDNVTGCAHTPVVCDDGNACTDNMCDTVTGCYYTTKVCDDMKNCTDNSCDNRTGCLFPPIECDDGNICTEDTCVEDVGCVQTAVDCEACQQFYDDGGNCSDLPCQTGRCVKTGPSTAGCEYTNWDAPGGKCDTGNLCILGGCDYNTGKCTRTPINCSHEVCFIVACNPATGQCDQTPRVCDDGDPCTVDSCVDDECRTVPLCPQQNCSEVKCVTNGTSASCQYTPKVCNTGTACRVGTCNVGTNECEFVDVVCDDGLFCTDDYCDATIGCAVTNHSCDDKNPCTLDFCDESRRNCTHTPKCHDELYCTEDVCLPDGTCVYPAISCEGRIDVRDSVCLTVVCNEAQKCHREVSMTAHLDMCGNCMNVLENMSLISDPDAAKLCVGALSWPKLATGLAAGIIAVIVICAIIGAVAVGTAGVFGTRQLIKMANAAQDQGAVNNPMYQANGKEMTNPSYAGSTPRR